MNVPPYFKALAAPILLPHNITRYYFDYKYLTILAIWSDSLTPKLINGSLFNPQPSKSKEAKPKVEGNPGRRVNASTLDELLPWRYNTTNLHFESTG